MSLIMRDTVDNVKHRIPAPSAGSGKAGDAADSAGADADADAADPLELMHRLVHRVRTLQHGGARGGAATGLTPQEARVLGFFARRPAATQSDLATHSGRDRGQIARVIAGLRERGLLLAVANPGDRRQVQISLSTQGRALQRTLERGSAAWRAQALGVLSAGERMQLVALLHKLQRGLEAAETG